MRGHLDKFAGDLQIHALHLGKIFEVLIQNIGDLQIADLYFVFRKQHQDQAERTGKVLQLIPFPDDALEVKIWVFHVFLSEQVFSKKEAPAGKNEELIRQKSDRAVQGRAENTGEHQQIQQDHPVALVAHQLIVCLVADEREENL